MRWFAVAALAPALALAAAPPVVLEFDRAGEAEVADAVDTADDQWIGRRARSIEIEGGWSGRVSLPLRACDVLTPQKVSESIRAIRNAVRAQRETARLQQSGGAIDVLYIGFDYDARPGSGQECGGVADTVAVVFKPYNVHLSLERVGDNVLPLPRSPLATLKENLPPSLAELQPRIGINRDRAFGTWLEGRFERAGPIEVKGGGRESLTSAYYEADGTLQYRHRLRGPTLHEYRLRAAADGSREPLGGSDHRRNAVELGLGLTLKLGATIPLLLDTAWREERNRVNAAGTPGVAAGTGLLANRALLDKLMPSTRGFVRASVWQDNGRDDATQASFHRLALRAGYAQEIRVRPGETLGLEVIAGAGTLSGEAPVSSRFFGGNAPVQFLYDSPASQQMFAMPRGPLVRSLGEAQAGLGKAGGTSFWHLNVNLALPLRGWSRPLIPDAVARKRRDGTPQTLKEILHTQIDRTGPVLMTEALKKQGMSEEQAAAQTRAAFAEIQPAVSYLIDDAYLYAVRPLLMLDAAGLSGGDGGRSDRWLALGAGASLTVVVARFEAGYMRTVSGPRQDEGHGAFFMRLVFQNLF